MKRREPKNDQVFGEAAKFAAGRIRPFKDDGAILDAVRILSGLRGRITDNEDAGTAEQARRLERRVARRMRDALAKSSAEIYLVQTIRRLALNDTEQELLLFLVASAIGIIPRIQQIANIQEAMNRSGSDRLIVARAFAEHAKLMAEGLISLDDEEDFAESNITVSQELLAPLLNLDASADKGWEVKTQEELLARIYPLFTELNDRAQLLDGQGFHFHMMSGLVMPTNRKIERLTKRLVRTLEFHPDWEINHVAGGLNWSELHIMVALIGKDLGYLDASDDMFCGEGLARCASPQIPRIAQSLALLRRESTMRENGLIRVCGGYGDSQVIEDEGTLRSCEFELTPETREKLDIKRQQRVRRTRSRVRSAVVAMADLAHSDKVRFSLEMLLANGRNVGVMLDEWGLGAKIAYGRGVTALFSGPPGTGKTASAEAIAHAMGKPILAIDYAEIQNAFVGETEKNITRVFREAREAEAVLFWDEADAMFFNRDSAYRNWEVREVNVLLQELERFDGVCILSTNRKVTLDPALERRIAVKVEFERPDLNIRREIWRRMIPDKLPMLDVDVEKLAACDLTGGEIKNVVLNAARIALSREGKGPVTMADFERAIAMETTNRWSRQGGAPIGFQQTGRIDPAISKLPKN
ncbi:MAG: ATP-binding protein [Candidatus Binatus sp.]|uniref:ATP-binding protein n=1 Tax=Candidatus Binatus sp. TaxID=2811406 RepID=UPI00271A88F7|nr:ATP-binding protein [Candidatus Binatus sp.]MDO8433076.1 ATP-binding protein [Candidatus Binatus sp.]